MPEAPGDVLAVSRVRPTGRPTRSDDTGSRGGAEDDRTKDTENEDRSHVGTRDVTEGNPGGTGPVTGGSGTLKSGSGATGTDIGS